MSLFEWDQQKNDANKLKHGISFEDTLPVFHDEQAVTIEDSHHGEQRWKTLGMGKYLIIVVVVFTHRNKIRIISARKATKTERRKYESRR